MPTRPEVPPAALSPAGRLIRPFQRFFQLESSSGIVLLLMGVLALLWANSPFREQYDQLWSTIVSVSVGGFGITKPLLLWINDGLMAIFFFVVGLEIKREVLVGELAAPKKAALSVAAATGGMLAPALIYSALNAGGAGAAGWGIPMATDIAFALGVLALLGKRVPLSLKVFLTAVAIVDDLGAVIVIALFYTEKLSLPALGIGFAFFLAMIAANRTRIHHPLVYLVLGIGLWVAFLKSGVHATIAGVLAAFTIPAQRRLDFQGFLALVEDMLRELKEDYRPGLQDPSPDQRDAIHVLEEAAGALETPAAQLEHALHPWVAFLIMPVFALANAGVALGGDGGSPLNAVSLGILLGLFLGKQVGVLTASWAAVRVGWAQLPEGVTWRQMYGVSLLCGIGFTMSLFIANLAFADAPQLLGSAKVGVLLASLIAGAAGAAVLWRARPGDSTAEAGGTAP